MKTLLAIALCLLATPAMAQKQTATAPKRLAATVGVTVSQSINITVTGGFPVSVACNPAAPMLPSNAPIGTPICALSAVMADGSAFAGTFGVSGASGIMKIGSDGKSVVTARALTTADIAASPLSGMMSATQ